MTAEERKFFQMVASVALCNPFSGERADLDRMMTGS